MKSVVLKNKSWSWFFKKGKGFGVVFAPLTCSARRYCKVRRLQFNLRSSITLVQTAE